MVEGMARPYKDRSELATEPVPERRSPHIPEDAVIVVGVWHPGAPAPTPVVLLPGYDYRLRQYAPGLGEDAPPPGWIIERRAVSRDDD